MSAPLTPFEWWETGTTQPSIPVNNNALRAMIGMTSAVSDAVSSQPALVSPGDDGLWYVMTATPSGSQWGGFQPNSCAIFFGGNWYEFIPADGDQVGIDCSLYCFSSSAGWSPIAGGGGGGGNRNTVSALSTSGSVAVDFSLGDYFTLALAGNVTGFTFTNLPGSGKGATLMIRITQDSTPRTVAWPASFKWAGGSAGSVSTASGAVDVLAITTFDNGTTWDATLAKAFA